MTQVINLAPAEVRALVDGGGVTLVDVREAGEFAAVRIAGAVLMPLSRFDPSALPSGELVLYCAGGVRSVTAIQHCAAAGLPHTRHLAGGIMAWRAAGLPTER